MIIPADCSRSGRRKRWAATAKRIFVYPLFKCVLNAVSAASATAQCSRLVSEYSLFASDWGSSSIQPAASNYSAREPFRTLHASCPPSIECIDSAKYALFIAVLSTRYFRASLNNLTCLVLLLLFTHGITALKLRKIKPAF